jgi:hypothetical protein
VVSVGPATGDEGGATQRTKQFARAERASLHPLLTRGGVNNGVQWRAPGHIGQRLGVRLACSASTDERVT